MLSGQAAQQLKGGLSVTENCERCAHGESVFGTVVVSGAGCGSGVSLVSVTSVTFVTGGLRGHRTCIGTGALTERG